MGAWFDFIHDDVSIQVGPAQQFPCTKPIDVKKEARSSSELGPDRSCVKNAAATSPEHEIPVKVALDASQKGMSPKATVVKTATASRGRVTSAAPVTSEGARSCLVRDEPRQERCESDPHK